jgi:hypothetical protein
MSAEVYQLRAIYNTSGIWRSLYRPSPRIDNPYCHLSMVLTVPSRCVTTPHVGAPLPLIVPISHVTTPFHGIPLLLTVSSRCADISPIKASGPSEVIRSKAIRPSHSVTLIVKDILHILKSGNIIEATTVCNSFQAGREWAIRTKEPLTKLCILMLWIYWSP